MAAAQTIKESKYLWMLESEDTITVFMGFDHVRRTSTSYKSRDKPKMIKLAESIAKQHQLEIIHNFKLVICA